MAKKCMIYRNLKRAEMAKRQSATRKLLKKQIIDLTLSPEERFQAMLKLAKLPKNGSLTRVRNICQFTGRARGNFKLFGVSRIAFRELCYKGFIPGVRKASW